MNNKDFEYVINKILGLYSINKEYTKKLDTKIRSILLSKAHDYSIVDNRLINFETCSSHLNISPVLVCHTYMMKHVLAIENSIKFNKKLNESLEERIIDIIIYSILGIAIKLKEHKKYVTTHKKIYNKYVSIISLCVSMLYTKKINTLHINYVNTIINLIKEINNDK